jgi:type IV secretory pathway TraG/TraD family ATPase VirD4
MNVWSAYWKANQALARGTASAVHSQATASQVRRGSRGARRGYLVPGDPPPVASAGGGYFDYRGVLDLKTVPGELTHSPFPLGQFFSPARGPRGPIALPEGVVARHVALVGPTGAGKTTGVVVPWMLGALRAGWSVIAIDVKGDLLANVERENGGSLGTSAAEYTYTRPRTSMRWNWLSELDSDRAIDSSVAAVLGREAPKGVDPFYYDQDCMILRGMLELVAAGRQPVTVTTTKLLGLLKDQARLEQVLRRTRSQQARQRLRNLVADAPSDYLKRITGVTTRLDAMARGTIDAVTAVSDFRVQDLLDNSLLLSVVAPMQDGQLANTFSTLLINQILYRAYERFGGEQGVPVLLVLDEAAQIADRIDIEQILSVARAAGVAVLFALQDARQFKDENQRAVLFANAGTVICTAGVSPDTARLASQRIGMHPVATTTTTSVGPYTSGQSYGPSLSTSTTMAPVLGEREIMHPPFGRRAACVHSPDLSGAPFFVDLQR